MQNDSEIEKDTDIIVDSSSDDHSGTDELIHELEMLHTEVHKQNSTWHSFINGVVAGLGRTVGATVVFAIIIAILSYIVRTSDAQWVTDLLSWLGLTTYLNL